MNSSEQAVIEFLTALARSRWEHSKLPVDLAAAGSALRQAGLSRLPTDKSLKSFVLRTQGPDRYRLVERSGGLLKQAIIPAEVRMSHTSGWVPPLPLQEPMGLKRSDTREISQKFSHGRSNTVVVETRQRRLKGQSEPVSGPQPVEGVPSAFGYRWSDSNTIVIESSSANIPYFPFPSSEREHARRLEACRAVAIDVIQDLRRTRPNVRPEYENELERYIDRLPEDISTGNILLADTTARIIRLMFATEVSFLPVGLAASLRAVLELHLALRPFYPELEVFYRDVQSGHLQEPLPLDAVDAVVEGIRAHTPEIFDRTVATAIDESAASPPTVTTSVEQPIASDNSPAPPPDPLGELDPKKARDVQVAGVVNKLWQVFLKGESIYRSGGAWKKSYDRLAPAVARLLEWLVQIVGR